MSTQGDRRGKAGGTDLARLALKGLGWSMIVGTAAMVAGFIGQVAMVAGGAVFLGRLAVLAYQRREALAEAACSIRGQIQALQQRHVSTQRA